jgi:hypothetical protein
MGRGLLVPVQGEQIMVRNGIRLPLTWMESDFLSRALRHVRSLTAMLTSTQTPQQITICSSELSPTQVKNKVEGKRS